MIRIWLQAIRPKTLSASIAPVLLGGALSLNLKHFETLIFLATLLGALFLQIGSNLVNDYFDFKKGADTHERKGPVRIMQAGLATEKQMRGAIVIIFTLAFGIGLYLVSVGGWPILMIGILSILCAIAYTAGPRPLAYIGLGDLFVFIFFGPLAVCGTVYLQVGTFDKTAFLMSIPLGAVAVGILTVNNVRDFNEDARCKKNTLVVRFGRYYGVIQYIACLALSLLLPTFYFLNHLVPKGVLLCWPLIFLAVPMIKGILQVNDPLRLNKLLGETGRFLLLLSFTQCLGLIL